MEYSVITDARFSLFKKKFYEIFPFLAIEQKSSYNIYLFKMFFSLSNMII